jgi:carboxyl-terminal processing protease
VAGPDPVNPADRRPWPGLAGLLALLGVAAGASAQPADLPGPWRGSGLDFSFFEERVQTEACQRDRVSFLSCIGAVQALLDANGLELAAVPADEVGEGAPVVRRFGELAVVKDTGPRMAGTASPLEVIRTRAGRLLRWREHFDRSRPAGVDFSALAGWLKADLEGHAEAEDLAAAAINGYVRVADPHARIAPPGSGPAGPRRVAARQSETYSGIGASVQGLGDAALVTAVVRGGPAARAGLQVQDVLLSVDGDPVLSLPDPELVERLRGPAGTAVTLRVKRAGGVRSLLVTRDRVSVRRVQAESLVDRGWRLVYLRVGDFLAPDTCRAVERELRAELRPNVSGLILDLRDNAGGLIDQAACVADLLLPRRLTVARLHRTDRPGRSQALATRRPQVASARLVVLVNAATASASELLAGALQDHGRGLILGERTFGKGTVQTVRPWAHRPEVLELFTAARFDRPSGGAVQLAGVEPDVSLPEEPGAEGGYRPALREEDLFPTPLPEASAPRATASPRPVAGGVERECAREEGLAGQRSARERGAGGSPDYGRLVAQDLLVCALGRSP